MSQVPGFPFPAEGGDVPPELARRLAEDPLGEVELPSGDQAVVAVRHADVRQVLSDPRMSRELHYPGAPRLVKGTDVGEDPSALINMDPPRHTRLRRIASVAFTPRRVERWRPWITRAAEDLVDEITGSPVDLVAAFAFPFPIRVICSLLGVPEDDRERFRAWSDAFLSTTDQSADERLDAGKAFSRYVWELVARRRAEPADALVDALIQARDGDEALSERELVRLVVGLIIAGHETTATVISRGVLQLLAEGHYAALAADPSRVPATVEEILRLHVPGDGGMLRVATEDVALASGPLGKGRAIMPSVAAANRDPGVFAEPDKLDISRAECPHLTFGHGPHYCLGANLARLELQVAFTTLATRLPGLTLAEPEREVPWRAGLMVRRPERLLVNV